jgi:anti-sigma B factor antagonist
VKCTERKVNDAVVVDVEGKLVGGPDSEAFHGLIKRLLSDGEKRIVINLQETPWANSQGIGLLIGALTSVTNAGGQLVLANAGERIHDILKVTKLYMIFDSFGTIDDAIQSLLDGRNGGSARLAGMRTIIPA